MAQRAEHLYMELLARQIVARNWRFRLRGKSNESLFESVSKLGSFEAQQLKREKVPHAAVAFGLVGLASYLYLDIEEKSVHQFSWQAAHLIASEAMGLRPGFIFITSEWRRVVEKLRNALEEITNIYSIILHPQSGFKLPRDALSKRRVDVLLHYDVATLRERIDDEQDETLITLIPRYKETIELLNHLCESEGISEIVPSEYVAFSIYIDNTVEFLRENLRPLYS